MSAGWIRLVVASGVVAVIAIAPAAAQPGSRGPIGDPMRPPPAMLPPPPSAVSARSLPRVRDGLLVRALVGLDAMRASFEGRGDQRYTGTGLGVTLALGSALTPRWSLYAELFRQRMTAPRYSIDGSTVTLDAELTVDFIGLGGGVAYYFGGGDLYVAGSLSTARLRFERSGDAGSPSRFGPAIALQVGREWWLADTISVGVAARAFVGTAPERYDGNLSDYRTAGASLAVTAAYD